MLRTPMSPFGLCRERVAAMIAGGEPLSSVERMLGAAELSAEESDALWLFAWSLEQRLHDRDRSPHRMRGRPAATGAPTARM